MKMRLTNRNSMSFAKWTLAIGIATIGCLATNSQAHAHHPFRHHGCFGLTGWGSHYYGGYSSFYGFRSAYGYPSYSFGYVPRYYSVSYYTPAYFAPVYYSPVYYAPAYYAPTYFAPACNSWSSIDYNISSPLASNSIPRYSAFADATSASSNRTSSPLAMQSRAIEAQSPLAGIPVARKTTAEVVRGLAVSDEKAVQLVSHKPALLQPYSPIWTKAAVGIVDDMIAAGEFDHAQSSCKSMERITQPKGAGVYLRQALLGYFSSDANASKPSTEEALNMLELACQAGSRVQASELGKDSLRSYFAACLVDVSETMEKLSQSVLESHSDPAKELLLLSALLKLNGQPDRARLFAKEVEPQAANGRSFKWHNLFNACLTDTM